MNETITVTDKSGKKLKKKDYLVDFEKQTFLTMLDEVIVKCGNHWNIVVGNWAVIECGEYCMIRAGHKSLITTGKNCTIVTNDSEVIPGEQSILIATGASFVKYDSQTLIVRSNMGRAMSPKDDDVKGVIIVDVTMPNIIIVDGKVVKKLR